MALWNSCTWAHDDVKLPIAGTNKPRVLNKQGKEQNLSGHKWSTTQRVPKPYQSKMSVIYTQSWKQCALPAITIMILWQLMHLGTWCAEFLQSHCGAWVSTKPFWWWPERHIVFIISWLHIYYDHLASAGLYLCIYIFIYNIYNMYI